CPDGAESQFLRLAHQRHLVGHGPFHVAEHHPELHRRFLPVCRVFYPRRPQAPRRNGSTCSTNRSGDWVGMKCPEGITLNSAPGIASATCFAIAGGRSASCSLPTTSVGHFTFA